MQSPRQSSYPCQSALRRPDTRSTGRMQAAAPLGDPAQTDAIGTGGGDGFNLKP